MEPKLSDIIDGLKRWDYVTVGLRGSQSISAYIGSVEPDRLELLIVLNAYRHFSNISDPPEVESRWIDRNEIVSVKK